MTSRIRFRVGSMALVVATLWGQPFPRAVAQDVPEENRKQVVEALGPPFIVFREKVLDELKVSDEQRQKLMPYLLEQIMETGPFLEALPATGAEREQKLAEHRKQALEKLTKHLGEVLQPDQRKRLGQVVLQQEGAFALGREDVRNELKITQEQMKQFMAIVQGLHRSVEPWSRRRKRAATPKRSDRRSSNSARTTPGSSKPSSTTPRRRSGRRCSAHRSTWAIDRGRFPLEGTNCHAPGPCSRPRGRGRNTR